MKMFSKLIDRWENFLFSANVSKGYAVSCHNYMKIFKYYCRDEKVNRVYNKLDWFFFNLNEDIVEFIKDRGIEVKFGVYKKDRRVIRDCFVSINTNECTLDECLIIFPKKTDATLFLTFFQNCESKLDYDETEVMIFGIWNLYKNEETVFVATYKEQIKVEKQRHDAYED